VSFLRLDGPPLLRRTSPHPFLITVFLFPKYHEKFSASPPRPSIELSAHLLFLECESHLAKPVGGIVAVYLLTWRVGGLSCLFYCRRVEGHLSWAAQGVSFALRWPSRRSFSIFPLGAGSIFFLFFFFDKAPTAEIQFVVDVSGGKHLHLSIFPFSPFYDWHPIPATSPALDGRRKFCPSFPGHFFRISLSSVWLGSPFPAPPWVQVGRLFPPAVSSVCDSYSVLRSTPPSPHMIIQRSSI